MSGAPCVAVGVDLDPRGSDWLIDRAVAFAARAGARLHVVHVGDAPDARARLDALAARVPADRLGEARLLAGEPEDRLVELSGTCDALVIGPREPKGLERLLRGAMVVRVLHRSRCPVYVPRCERFGAQRPRLLLGLDLRSDRLEFAVAEAARWAHTLDGTLDLVHALPRTLPALNRPELREAAHREWERTHRDVLARLQPLLDTVPPENRGVARIAPGEAEDVLVDASDDCDLLLVGNRDRRGIERLLLGGVARVVVLRARCDVLVLPTGTHGA